MDKFNAIITIDGKEIFNYSNSTYDYILTTTRLTNNIYERKIIVLLDSLIEAEELFKKINEVKESINISIYDISNTKVIENEIRDLSRFLLFTSTENNEIKVNLTLILDVEVKEWE